MPSASYGRGGGNFVKKPKVPKSKSNANDVDGSKSSDKVSFLKKITLVLPGTQSRKSWSSAHSQPNQDVPAQGPRPWDLYASPLSPSLTNNSSLPPTLPRPSIGSQTPSYPFVIDINGGTGVNLNSITPSSSDDESVEFERRARASASVDILPFSSYTAGTQRTAINGLHFPSRDTLQSFRTSASLPTRLRSRSVSDNSQPLNVHFKAEPIGANPRADRGDPSGSEGRVSSSGVRLARGDGKFMRARGMSLVGSVPAPTAVRRRPVSILNPVVHWTPPNPAPQAHVHTHSHCCDEAAAPSNPPSKEDSFDHLFISCAISILLLIVLALGKDALYVMALLPVLVTLGKHFLDMDYKLRLYIPFSKKKLESMISF